MQFNYCNAGSFGLRFYILCIQLFRNVVSSPAGVRVVEIRDESGLVLSSWQFLESEGVAEFTLPPDAVSGAEQPLSLIAEDSVGNILRCHV